MKQEGKGVIFTLGCFHYEKLVKAFAEEGCLSNVIFIHPYSPRRLTREVEDRKLATIADEYSDSPYLKTRISHPIYAIIILKLSGDMNEQK